MVKTASACSPPPCRLRQAAHVERRPAAGDLELDIARFLTQQRQLACFASRARNCGCRTAPRSWRCCRYKSASPSPAPGWGGRAPSRRALPPIRHVAVDGSSAAGGGAPILPSSSANADVPDKVSRNNSGSTGSIQVAHGTSPIFGLVMRRFEAGFSRSAHNYLYNATAIGD